MKQIAFTFALVMALVGCCRQESENLNVLQRRKRRQGYKERLSRIDSAFQRVMTVDAMPLLCAQNGEIVL